MIPGAPIIWKGTGDTYGLGLDAGTLLCRYLTVELAGSSHTWANGILIQEAALQIQALMIEYSWITWKVSWLAMEVPQLHKEGQFPAEPILTIKASECFTSCSYSQIAGWLKSMY